MDWIFLFLKLFQKEVLVLVLFDQLLIVVVVYFLA